MLEAYSGPDFDRMLSLREREQLYEDWYGHFTAFSPRPESTSAVRLSPVATDTKINVRHKTRTPVDEQTVIYPLPNYQTWKDAGDIAPVLPLPYRAEYNSNVWRTFSKDHTSFEAKGRKISELVASMYPIPIPPPSRMGDYTYGRFIKYGDIMKTGEAKEKKITRTERELEEMKRLDVLTKARVPPTDNKGRIVAPQSLRRLRAQGRIKHRPMSFNAAEEARNRDRVETLGSNISEPASLVTRSTSLRHKGLLWKFSYKLNNPVYEKVVGEQQDVHRWKQNNARIKAMRKSKMMQRIITYY